MDLETRKKIARTMKGHSNFEGHKHTHATKVQIGMSQEGHRNAAGLKWSINRNTGKETRTATKLPQGNRWGRTREFKSWIRGKDRKATPTKANESVMDSLPEQKIQSFKAWKAKI